MVESWNSGKDHRRLHRILATFNMLIFSDIHTNIN